MSPVWKRGRIRASKRCRRARRHLSRLYVLCRWSDQLQSARDSGRYSHFAL